MRKHFIIWNYIQILQQSGIQKFWSMWLNVTHNSLILSSQAMVFIQSFFCVFLCTLILIIRKPFLLILGSCLLSTYYMTGFAKRGVFLYTSNLFTLRIYYSDCVRPTALKFGIWTYLSLQLYDRISPRYLTDELRYASSK